MNEDEIRSEVREYYTRAAQAAATATVTTEYGEPAVTTPTPSTWHQRERRSSRWDAGTRWP